MKQKHRFSDSNKPLVKVILKREFKLTQIAFLITKLAVLIKKSLLKIFFKLDFIQKHLMTKFKAVETFYI